MGRCSLNIQNQRICECVYGCVINKYQVKKRQTEKRKLRPFAKGRTQSIRLYSSCCVKKRKKNYGL